MYRKTILYNYMIKLLQTSTYRRAAGCIAILLLSSCAAKTPNYNFQLLAKAAVRLDVDIDKEDDHNLYLETSKWIGVPYRRGGNTMRGTDCSGFTSTVYKKVYQKKIQHNSESQRITNCHKVSKRHLEEGDLVFFHNGRRKDRASHVGIYLKEGRFVHSSTTRGVIVSSLEEEYYKKHWMHGGRVR